MPFAWNCLPWEPEVTIDLTKSGNRPWKASATQGRIFSEKHEKLHNCKFYWSYMRHSTFLLRWTKNLSSYLGSYYKWYSLYNSSRKRWNEDDGNDDDDSPHDPFYSRCYLFAPNIDGISPPPRSLERRLFLQATRLNYFSSNLHFVQKLKLPYALHLYLSYFIYTFHTHNATFYGGVHKTSNSSFSFWT